MLGARKQRGLDRSVVVSLEALVPPDHFYRHLEAKLDLSFVRELVRDHYAAIGRPSIDPVVFFKLQLILFFESLRSERSSCRPPRSTSRTGGTWATTWTSRCLTTPASPAATSSRTSAPTSSRR